MKKPFSWPCRAKPRPSSTSSAPSSHAQLDVVLDPLACARRVTTGPYWASGSVETPTFSVSISASSLSRSASAVLSPTGTTTGRAMQRSPAEP